MAEANDYGEDPIAIPHEFSRPEDIEVVAFIVSCFAYGSRKVFVPLMRQYIEKLGKHPARTLREADTPDITKLAKAFKYRFNDSDDLRGLYTFISNTLNFSGSLGMYFRSAYTLASKAESSREQPVLEMLSRAESLYGGTALPRKGSLVILRNRRSSMYLLPSPDKGSTCKRALMFARWMIRTGHPDFGLWTWADPAKLVVPLDTHLRRVAIQLGMLDSDASSSLKTAIKLTDKLRKFDSADPVKFDYSLYMMGADERHGS